MGDILAALSTTVITSSITGDVVGVVVGSFVTTAATGLLLWTGLLLGAEVIGI